MIDYNGKPDGGRWYFVVGDSIVRRGWQGQPSSPPGWVGRHGGLYGAPLSEPCPESHAEAGAWCATCSGSGRVRPGKPKTKTPTP